MKKYLLLLLILILTVPLFAQLEVKEGSFKEVPGFVNINPDDNYQTDDNDLPFAVIKIRTENINDKQRRELKFSGNAGTFIMLEYKDGEVWVYLTAEYADYLKISHPDFSSIEFTLPFDLKPKCGYEMTLVNKAEATSNGWASLTITTTPENGAEITLNGRTLNQTTPYTNNMIPAGKYEITVSKFGFEDASQTISIIEGQSVNLDISMPYRYGTISIKSDPPGAIVFIDDIEYGITPIILNNIKFGSHVLKLKKEFSRTYKQQITISDQTPIALNIVLDGRPEGALDGLFSIDKNKHVYFSKGNLQYHINKRIWRFSENQWDFIGEKNEKRFSFIAPYKGWTDLFVWGKGDNPTEFSRWTNYKWNNNKISNGGNNSWRTLTRNEWDYILNHRSTPSGVRYAHARVNGIGGLIILPDNWDANIYNLINANDSSINSSCNDNTISADVWVSIFEANGAVFLPFAGLLYNISVMHTSFGNYQTSTPYDPDYSHYVFCFSNGGVFLSSHESNSTGCSIRLVCDVE